MVKIWGHRGCRGKRAGGKPPNPPENSLAAFAAAIAQGADGFELDVFLTQPDQPRKCTLVVFHDDTLERMSTGEGNTADYTLAELKKLRLKDNDGAITDQEIPTLDEVLDVADAARRTNPDFTVNIEIKGTGTTYDVAQTIAHRLRHGWQRHNFSVSSFYVNSLRKMRQADPNIPIGLLLEDPEVPNTRNIRAPLLTEAIADVSDIHPDTVNITLPSVTPEAIRVIETSGAKPLAWTDQEENPETLQHADGGRALAARIHSLDAIITDYPEEMRALLEKYPPGNGGHTS